MNEERKGKENNNGLNFVLGTLMFIEEMLGNNYYCTISPDIWDKLNQSKEIVKCILEDVNGK